jgi:hypothetical protein
MRAVRRAVVVFLILPLSACSASPERPSSGTSKTAGSMTAAPLAPLVGRWEQSAHVHTCENYVRGMETEHLLAAVEAAPLSPGETWKQVAGDYCRGPSEDFDVSHSHFFDQYGRFGSVDQNNNQVDNGKYTIVNDHTMRIGTSAFHYHVSGDTLTLEPVITKADRREALSKPGKFTDATWMVAVAFPGTSWHRVDCAGWC